MCRQRRLAYAVGARCQWPGVVKLRGPVRIYISSSAAPVESQIQFMPLWNSSFPTTATPGGDEQARQEHRSSFLANGRGMRQFLMMVVWPLSYSRTHESSHVFSAAAPQPPPSALGHRYACVVVGAGSEFVG